jgi:lysophospholipase L1-like esterase
MSIQTKTMIVKSDTSLAETSTTIRDTVTFDVSNMPNGITYKGLKAVLSFAEPIQWNKASTYDALTVVWDDASHGSYASKRNVPANIELTNEFYWLRTADLDAQVEMYRQEVKEFDGRITANANAIAAEAERATKAEQTLQANIENEAERATKAEQTLQANIENEKNRAENDVNNLAIGKYNGTIVAFGDSITRGYGTTDLHSWAWYVANYFGATIKNYAVDGASFTFNIPDQVDTATNDTSYDHSAVKIVLIGGGINDHEFNYAQISEGIEKTINKVKAEFPNAKIYIVPCLSAAKFMNQIDQGDGKLIHVPAIYSVLTACMNLMENGISVMENAPLLAKGQPKLANDNVHPNNQGARIIGASVYSWINGGNGYNGILQAQIPFNENITVNSSVVESNGYGFYAALQITPNEQIPGSTPITPKSEWLGFSTGTVPVFPSMTDTGTGPMFFVLDSQLYARESLKASTTYYISINGVVGV